MNVRIESLIIITICVVHLIALITSLVISINDEQDAAVALQSAWDLFDASGAGPRISALSSDTSKRATQFTWQATADALADITKDSMPKFLGGALQDNSSSYSASATGILGNNQILPLHVVSSAIRFVQHRSTPRLCDNDLLSSVGPSYNGFSGVSKFCPAAFTSSTKRSPVRCCIKDFTATELDSETKGPSTFTSTNSSNPTPATFRKVEVDDSALFSGPGVASALRPTSIFYPYTGFALEVKFAGDLQTVVLSSDGQPVSNGNVNLNGDDNLHFPFRDFVDPLTRYVRFSILTIYWSAAVAVHLHVHMELPASGSGIAAWRKASAVNIRPGLFSAESASFASNPSAKNFDSSYNDSLVGAEIFAMLTSFLFAVLILIRYRYYFARDPTVPIYFNSRFLLDIVAAAAMLCYLLLRLLLGFQTSKFADSLGTAMTYQTTPIGRSTDFISGSYTRFMENLRGGCEIASFIIAILWPVRYIGVFFQIIRRALNAKTLGGVPELAEDSRTGSSSIELLPAVMRRYFVDVIRVMTWCMAPLFLLCALALSVLRGPDQFYYSYSGSAMGTLLRDRVLNLFAGFLISTSKETSSSYWSHPNAGAYWMDLIVGTLIEIVVPFVFFCGLIFLGVRSCQEDVYAGKGKSAFFHHEDEEDARIVQIQLFARRPGLAATYTTFQTADERNKILSEEKEKTKPKIMATEKGKEYQTLQEPLLANNSNGGINVPSENNNDNKKKDDSEDQTDEPYSDSQFGTTVQLQNEVSKRKLLQQIRILSETLRNRIGLVPPANRTKQTATKIVDPYFEIPSVLQVSREAAIERLILARQVAERQGKSLTPQDEMNALREETPKTVLDAIQRIGEMYEDLSTLLIAGKTIRDALVDDTKKTVAELEKEMEKQEKVENERQKKVLEELEMIEKPKETTTEITNIGKEEKTDGVTIEEIEGKKSQNEQAAKPHDPNDKAPPEFDEVDQDEKKQNNNDL